MPREEGMDDDDDDAVEQSSKTPSPLEVSLSLSLSIVILLKLFSHLPFVVKKFPKPITTDHTPKEVLL